VGIDGSPRQVKVTRSNDSTFGNVPVKLTGLPSPPKT
jgi:hypothetical protein